MILTCPALPGPTWPVPARPGPVLPGPACLSCLPVLQGPATPQGWTNPNKNSSWSWSFLASIILPELELEL